MLPHNPLPRLPLLALLAATALLYCWRLGDPGVVSEELRWAEIAREMRADDDYLRPTINGTVYPDKPVGSYWLIVLASHLTGGVNETAARLPSAVAGLLAVWLVVGLGTRLFDPRTGLFAGVVLATSFGFMFYARRASADEETVAGVLAALCLYERNRDAAGRWWVVPLWALMAATSLTKGLLGFALPLLTMAAETGGRVWADRRLGWRAAVGRHGGWLFNRWSAVAVPLGAGLYLLPFLLAAPQASADGLHMVWRENVKRFVAPHNHTGPVYLYVGALAVLAAPWSLLLPAALLHRPVRTPAVRFVRTYFWVLFAFFTASASRRNYYLLPVLPAAALLIAQVVLAPREELTPLVRRLRSAGWAGFVAAFALVPLAMVPPGWVLPAPYSSLPPLPYRGALAVGWLSAAAAWRVGRKAGGTVTAFVVLGYVFGVALPDLDGQRTRRGFLEEVRQVTAARPDQLALFHARDVVFDLGRTAPDYADAEPLAAAMHDGRVRWVLARKRYLAGVALPARIASEEPARPWEGIEQLGDKVVLLEAVAP